jgi:hypothetical protein
MSDNLPVDVDRIEVQRNPPYNKTIRIYNLKGRSFGIPVDQAVSVAQRIISAANR